MSSHREAPEIAKDPVADSTDLYAFVSPDKSSTVTLIANYVPLQLPSGGPNFYEFGEDVLYEIHIDTTGDAQADISYQFRFSTEVEDPNTFLYNTTPITSLTTNGWNRRQVYSVTRVDRTGTHVLGTKLPCPPCNIGPLSTPNYATALAKPAVRTLSDGSKVFAGQRAEGFFVDLGSIFDLGNLRPIQELNVYAKALGLSSAQGVNSTKFLNVHSIALQVETTKVTASGRPVIGVWTTASRQRVGIRHPFGDDFTWSGPQTQVSRLGNPLINEVIIPMGKKDLWNTQQPAHDKQFLQYYAQPELAGLIAALYAPNFPNLTTAVNNHVVRADLEAILLTGIPPKVLTPTSTFTTFTGAVQADMLRLNTSIPPTPATAANALGVLGGDLAGFPNGRRVFDDVVTIELRAVAGATLGLVTTYTPDSTAIGLIDDFNPPVGPGNPYLTSFPYLGVPYDGYDEPSW